MAARVRCPHNILLEAGSVDSPASDVHGRQVSCYLSSLDSLTLVVLFCAQLDATGLRIGIVTTRWNTEVVSKLKDGARQTLLDLGITETDIVEFEVNVCRSCD